MTTAFFSRRDLSVGDAPVIELSDSLESRPNEAPVGPTILDLKYVSISETNAGGVQQVNPGLNVDQEIDHKPCAEERGRGEPNVGVVGQPDQIPYAQNISSLETDLKEAQVIRAFAMEEIASLKTDLTSWVDKWNLLRVKKLKYKAQVKSLQSKNKKLIKQNKIYHTRDVIFKEKLDEERWSVLIRLSVESTLRT